MPVEIDSVNTSMDASTEAGDAAALTPELIKLVTERVYALLLKDMQIERERLRDIQNPFGRKGFRQ